MSYRDLLFDADNTLFDFTACERAALTAALRDFGIPLREGMLEIYSRYNEECWRRMERGELKKEELVVLRYALFFEHCGIDADPAAVEEVYEEHLSSTAFLLPGAKDLLKRFYGRAAIYVITNGLTRVQRGRFAHTDLFNWVNGVFISEEMGTKKPDALFFELVGRAIPGFDRSRALVIGDSLSSDIRGANNAGIDCVWFNPSAEKDTQGLRINKTVGSFDELAAFLEEHL